MECSCPGQRVGNDDGVIAHDLASDPFDPAGHFGRGPTRKRHQQDTARISTIEDEMRNAVRQRVGLSGARAGDDEQRRARRAGLFLNAMLHSSSLLRIEGI